MTSRFACVMVLSVMLVPCGCQNAPMGDGDVTQVDQIPAGKVEAVVGAATNLAGATAAIVPAADAQGLLNSVAGQFVSCPAVTITIERGCLDLTLDYGDGCQPLLYLGTIARGSVAGMVTVADSTIELTFDQFSFDDGDVWDGTMTGTLTWDDETVSLAAAVDLAINDTDAIDADLNSSVERSTGITTIDQASVAITEVEDAFAVVFDDLVIDLSGNENLIPESGTASFEMENPDIGPDTLAVVVEFTEDTPVDGTLLVSIGGASAIEYTPGG